VCRQRHVKVCVRPVRPSAP